MSPIDFSANVFKKLKNRNCAQILVEYLKLEGVRYVFGVSGGTIVPIMQALDEDSDISFIMTKHEAGAAFMADMYARVSGRLGVCLSTAGPGATNMLTGVACAQQDNIPVLAVTGQPATHTMGKGAVQESTGFGVNIEALYKIFSGLSFVIPEPAVFQQIVTQALRVALNEHRQAVHLSIPSNVSAHVFKTCTFPGEPGKYRVSHGAIDLQKIKKAAVLLAAAENPLIMVGGGIRAKQSIDDLIKIAELIGCPVVSTPQGKGQFPENHDLSLGVFGFAGNLCAKKYLFSESVDLLLVISSKLEEWTTESWDPRIFPKKYLVQIDIDAQNIGRNFPVSLGIVGDVGTAINCLLQALLADPRVKYENLAEERTRRVLDFKKTTGKYVHPHLYGMKSVPLKPQRLMRELNECLLPDSIVIADAGNAYAWTLHYLAIVPPMQFHIPLGFAAMGHGTAGVVGAKLAAPDKQVIAVCGDGSMLMNGSEIHTAAQYNIAAVWLVLNDGGWGMVSHGTRVLTGRSIGASFRAVDFSALARVYGATGFRITRPGELKEIIPAVRACAGPVVIDAVIDRDEEPPFIERIKGIARQLK